MDTRTGIAGFFKFIHINKKPNPMERAQLLLKVQEIFRDILEQDELVLHGETTSAQVQDWDSLNHIHLVTAIEKHFKIRFTAKEIQSWKKVDDLIESIATKLNA